MDTYTKLNELTCSNIYRHFKATMIISSLSNILLIYNILFYEKRNLSKIFERDIYIR